MKRNLMGYVAVRTGVANLLRQVLRNRLTVLAYHRIGGATSQFDALFDDSVYSCTDAVLDQQLTLLRQMRNVVTLDQVCDALDGVRTLPPRAALITFDDATQDHYSRAFPLLRRHNMTGVFFVSTRSLTERTIEWWNLLGLTVKRAAAGRYDLGQALGGPVILTDDESRASAIKTITAQIKLSSTAADALPVVLTIAKRLGVELPSVDQQTDGVISSAQLAEMQRAGMAIGSHTHSHPFLNRLSPEQQLAELTRSKRILEDLLQVPVRALAYPYGQASDYDQHSREAAKLAGYDCAFNLLKRRVVDVRNIDRFDIHRFPAAADADYRFEASISAIAV
ncbi:MAG: polysaccharide deacetylase family protein [Pseudomonadales bacterium]|nr:polysaccharide deacetylase family protein [Pseudomonadales bacterium]